MANQRIFAQTGQIKARPLAALCGAILLLAAPAAAFAGPLAETELAGPPAPSSPPAAPRAPEAAPEPALAPPASPDGVRLTPTQAAPPSPPSAPSAPSAPAPRAYRVEGAEIVLRDLAAVVFITPENRADVAVEIVNPGELPAPRVLRSSGRVIVDGDLDGGVNRCRMRDRTSFAVSIDRHGWVDEQELPQVRIRTPQDLSLNASGAVQIWAGSARSANIAISSCGRAELESVSDDADISVAGGGEVKLHEAGRASLRVAGSGDVALGVVRNGLAVSIAGGGDVAAQRVDGPTNIAIQGSGDVVIREGDATTLSIAIAGSGDVVHRGQANDLDVVILGSGDVVVRHVNGEISRRVLGSGDIVVGD